MSLNHERKDFSPLTALVNPNGCGSYEGRDSRVQQSELASALIGLASFGLPYAKAVLVPRDVIKIEAPEVISAEDLYGGSGIGKIPETVTWMQALGEMYKQYMAWELPQMMDAFLDGKLLTDEVPLNSAMVKARLGHGMVKELGKGYRLIQTTPEVLLTPGIMVADIIIAPDKNDDPKNIPVPTILRSTTINEEVHAEYRRYVVKEREWDQNSPLSLMSSKIINKNEADLHRALHDYAAKGLMDLPEVMKLNGEVWLDRQVVETIGRPTSTTTAIGFEKTGIRIRDGHIYTRDDYDRLIYMHEANHFIEEREYEQMTTCVTTSNLIEWKAIDVPAVGLLELIASGKVMPWDQVGINGSRMTLGELVKQKVGPLKQIIAEDTYNIALAAYNLAKYFANGSELQLYKASAVPRGVAETLLQTITQTWPAAHLRFANDNYLKVIADFLKLEVTSPEIIMVRDQ